MEKKMKNIARHDKDTGSSEVQISQLTAKIENLSGHIKKFKKDKNSYQVSIGQFGKIINILKENKCKKVLFAGKVEKPNFFKLKLDLKGIYYIPRIIKASKLGDAAILKEIIKILDQNKIKTENSLKFNPELSLKKGNYSKFKRSKKRIFDRSSRLWHRYL